MPGSTANGILHAPHRKEETQVWDALSRSLPVQDRDSEFWWRLTGSHLAALVEAAGYPSERRYEALLFHYNWIIPYMGGAPNVSPRHWRSTLQLDGTPLEYSWKWNSTSGTPDVRYLMEPIGQYAGTGFDPLNQFATRELLHRLSVDTPQSVELGWTDHFLATLFDHDRSKFEREKADGTRVTSSLFVAIKLLASGPSFETYFYPRTLRQPGHMAIERWKEAIAPLDPQNAARTALLDFVATSPSGQLLKPFCLSVDNVDQAKARLKWYFNSPHTSFTSVREIMSLGGRISSPHFHAQLIDLFELIRAVADLPKDWPDDKDVPTATPYNLLDPAGLATFKELPDLLSVNFYSFDIAPGKTLPDIKFYTAVRNFGRDDLSLAKSLIAWMDTRGRGAYGAKYVKALYKLSSHRHLHSRSGLQTFLGCQFKANGELDITSYLSPEALHPERLAPMRTSRLRMDDEW